MQNSVTIVLLGNVHGQPANPIADRYPSFTSLTLLVKRKWEDNEGQEKINATWYKCHTWSEELSQMIRNNIKEGARVIIKGIPKACAYIDKEGKPKAQIEVLIEEVNIIAVSHAEGGADNSVQPIAGSNVIPDNGRFKIAAKPTLEEVEVPNDEIPF